LDEAVRTVRRALGTADEAAGGWGYVGDLAIDFAVPPLVDRAYAGAVLATAGPIPEQVLAQIDELVAEGGCLLIAMRRPELALRMIAERLSNFSRRPRVLSCQKRVAWAPPGWLVLDSGSEQGRTEAFIGDPMVAIEPPGPVLEAILAALPRRLGGTVLALEAASVEAALEECARGVNTDLGAPLAAGGRQREAVSRHLDLILTQRGSSWRLLRAATRRAGEHWALDQLAADGPE
jgi:hypothetical protein